MRTKRLWICESCLRSQRLLLPKLSHLPQSPRYFGTSLLLRQSSEAIRQDDDQEDSGAGKKADTGALSRRLSEMTDEIVESGDHSARKAVEEAGFSDELKRQLEERIAGNSLRAQHPQAFSELDMPVSSRSFNLEQHLTFEVIGWRRNSFQCKCSTLDRN